jgi:hypothetical protein
MGNNNSINIVEKENGICQVNVKDISDYPIVYLRLCKNPIINKYCIAEDCDINSKFSEHRKVIVVGFRIKDKIYEQVFYLSSGLNSIQNLENFFKIKLITSDIRPEQMKIWLPFMGFGYDKQDLKKIDNLETEIKLLKDFFANQGSYGRFGCSDPNLMQISYCLGGQFWENNLEKFKKFNIKKLPTLFEYLNKKDTCNFKEIFKNDIECSVYLNHYIGHSLPENYSKKFLTGKINAFEKFKLYPWFVPTIKYDYRILYKILPKMGDIYILNYENKREVIPIILPLEQYFFNFYNWDMYLTFVNKYYNKNKKLFEENIKPLFDEEKLIIEILSNDTELIKDKDKDKDLPPEIISKKDFILGTVDSPHTKRTEAKIGEYYLKGKLSVKRNK